MSSSPPTIKEKTLSGLENLNRVLPTGTVFLYQLLRPVLTNNGRCSETIYKCLTATLVGMCGLSCFITSFTDSCKEEGKIHYGFATTKGKLWPSPEGKTLRAKKLGHEDFVHGFLAVFVFGVIVCLDRNTVDCFHPLSESQHRFLLEVLPTVVSAISSVVLLIFPNNRRGIGYVSLSNSPNDSNSSANSSANSGAPNDSNSGNRHGIALSKSPNDSNSGAPTVTRTEGSLSVVPSTTRTEGSHTVVSVVSCICR